MSGSLTDLDIPGEAMQPTSSPKIDLRSPEYYINRELGLIDFQRRVLVEAESEKYPLLERLKFLAYVYHNMDEFFMVRVGGLHMQNAAGVIDRSIDGKLCSSARGRTISPGGR